MRTIEYCSEVGVDFLEDFGMTIQEFVDLIMADPSWHFKSEIVALMLSGHLPEHTVELDASGDFWNLVTRFQMTDEEMTWFVLSYHLTDSIQ